MIIKKIIRYFLVVIGIFIATVLVLGVFYLPTIYHTFILTNRSKFPSFLVRIINRISPPPPTAPVLKAEKTIHIPEAWTNQEIAKYLATKEDWSSKDFLQVVGSAQAGILPATGANKASSSIFSSRFSFLKAKPKNTSLEGYLFPDTYKIYASSTIKEVVFRMLNNFNQKLTPKMRADIKAQGKTIYSIITMASIVEKEAPINYKDNDNQAAKIIAGIFWNRLKNGQALESDATLSYILNDKETRHSGRDLEVNSPYNTYKHRGLPPGPISNPGILAIEAAIYPVQSKYNYFITVPGTNKVVYARTYAQHIKNIYKYLR